jgi:pantetheine-phosphate adenylyltransferase
MSKKAVIPGSFDPITFGHISLIERSAELFDEVIIAIGKNVSKTGEFPLSERIQAVEGVLKDLQPKFPDVIIKYDVYDGLLADFVHKNEVNVIVKGIRNATDLDYEMDQAYYNCELSGVQTIFLPALSELRHISSSAFRELFRNNADLKIMAKIAPQSSMDIV